MSCGFGAVDEEPRAWDWALFGWGEVEKGRVADIEHRSGVEATR
jgi:hypothetical protein